jgi:hypothetical protein
VKGRVSIGLCVVQQLHIAGASWCGNVRVREVMELSPGALQPTVMPRVGKVSPLSRNPAAELTPAAISKLWSAVHVDAHRLVDH